MADMWTASSDRDYYESLNPSEFEEEEEQEEADGEYHS